MCVEADNTAPICGRTPNPALPLTPAVFPNRANTVFLLLACGGRVFAPCLLRFPEDLGAGWEQVRGSERRIGVKLKLPRN